MGCLRTVNRQDRESESGTERQTDMLTESVDLTAEGS